MLDPEGGDRREVNEVEGVNDGVKDYGVIVKRVEKGKDVMAVEVEDKEIQVTDVEVARVDDSGEVGENAVAEIDRVVNEVSLVNSYAVEENVAEAKPTGKEVATDTEQVARLNAMARMEQEGVERLVKLERVAEEERQKKIRRREELDRIARLQRILALVRAPELNSVETMKEAMAKRVEKEDGVGINVLEKLEVVTEVNSAIETKNIEGLAELKPPVDGQLTNKVPESRAVAKLEKVQEKLGVKINVLEQLGVVTKVNSAIEMENVEGMKCLEELNPAIDAELTMKVPEFQGVAKLKRAAEKNSVIQIHNEKEIKQEVSKEMAELKQLVEKVTVPELQGVAKLERMSKLERIKEIDRLIEQSNLEHQAAATRKAENKRKAEIERATELERMEEVKRIREIDLKAKLGQFSAREHFAEIELVVEKERQANVKQGEELERVTKLKREEEFKLFEALGIVPKVQPLNSRTEINSKVDVKLVAEKEQKPDLRLTEVELKPKPISVTEEKQVSMLTPDPLVTMKQLAEAETVEAVKMVPEKGAEIKHAEKMGKQTIIVREAKIKQREEIDRVAKLQRMLAEVRRSEFDRVDEMKAAKMAEVKRGEEMKLLESFGIVSNDKQDTQMTLETGVTSVYIPADEEKTIQKVQQIAEEKSEADVAAVIGVQPEVKEVQLEETEKEEVDIITITDKEDKIKRADEMENQAKQIREAKMKRREEIERVAKLQRVLAEMRRSEFDRVEEMKQIKLSEIKREEEMELLEKLGIVTPMKTKVEVISMEKLKIEKENKPVEELKSITIVEQAANLKPLVRVELQNEIKDIAKVRPEVDLEGSLATDPTEFGYHVLHKEHIAERESMPSLKQAQLQRIAELQVAQMRRVEELGREMKRLTVEEATEIEQLVEFKHVTEPTVKTGVTELKREELKSLPEGLKRDTVSEPADMKRVKGLKPYGELKRLGLGDRDCEWDGQMMYGRVYV